MAVTVKERGKNLFTFKNVLLLSYTLLPLRYV